MPRRITDLVEDAVTWMLIAAALLLLVAAMVAGVIAHGRLAERALAEGQERTRVTATVLETSPLFVSDSGYHPRVAVEATWVGLGGEHRTGRVPATAGTPVGSEVAVWLDHNGTVVEPPPTGFEVVAAGVLTGVGVLLLGGSVLALIWVRVKRAINAANARHWDREWDDIGPKWTR
ncbi:Rv1733c family protein [Pseudonocardia sp. CA-142604]|uniref:Rv1733c family protein n=1 Tax=Pseudonocardia sp. CA-142604 TaxID=3240024 RepID=UPI003D909704